MGWGSIGHRHIKNLLKYPDVEIIICTSKKSISTEIEKRCKIVKLLEDGISTKQAAEIVFGNVYSQWGNVEFQKVNDIITSMFDK